MIELQLDDSRSKNKCKIDSSLKPHFTAHQKLLIFCPVFHNNSLCDSLLSNLNHRMRTYVVCLEIIARQVNSETLLRSMRMPTNLV